MSNVLFDVSDERESLPTLRQWIKSIGKRKMAELHPVIKVWKPTKYKSICFETERFRAILYDGNVLYNQVAERLDDLCTSGNGLAIAPNRDKPGSFKIVGLDNESPTVRSIGEFGYEFQY
jgi:hypothetical protein